MRARSESLGRKALMRTRRAVGAVLVSPALGGVIGRVFRDCIPHRGLRISTSDPLIAPETKAALLFRAYESAEFRFMQRYLPADADVVELGGSIGVMTCLIRKKLRSSFQLVTVEADHRLIELLHRNLVANGCDRNTTIVNAAVAVTGKDEVAFATGASSLSGSVGAGVSTMGVRATSLSQLVKQQGFDRFNIVCDIEGAEWELWRLDRDALQRADWIILETHDHPDYGTWKDLVAEIEATPGFHVVDQYSAVVVVKTSG